MGQALRGFITSDSKQPVSRLAHHVMEVDVRTWERQVTVTMTKDGAYTVTERELNSGIAVGPSTTIASQGPQDG
jgi:hypothetical protein